MPRGALASRTLTAALFRREPPVEERVPDSASASRARDEEEGAWPAGLVRLKGDPGSGEDDAIDVEVPEHPLIGPGCLSLPRAK